MIYRGRVKGGVVVLDDPDARIPEGMAVRIEPVAESASVEAKELDPLFAMGDLAVETGVPDLSVNIDHYLYGHPKVGDDASSSLPVERGR
jgi:hypothetical protein